MTETPDDLLEPANETEPVDDPREDDDPGLSAEESLGMLPSD